MHTLTPQVGQAAGRHWDKRLGRFFTAGSRSCRGASPTRRTRPSCRTGQRPMRHRQSHSGRTPPRSLPSLQQPCRTLRLPARYFADDASHRCNAQRWWCARGAGCMPDCGALPDISSAVIAFDPYRFTLQAAAGMSADAAEVPKHETRGQMLQRHKRVRWQVYNTSAMVPNIAYADKLMHLDRNQHSTLDCAGGEGSQRRSEEAGQKTQGGPCVHAHFCSTFGRTLPPGRSHSCIQIVATLHCNHRTCR